MVLPLEWVYMIRLAKWMAPCSECREAWIHFPSGERRAPFQKAQHPTPRSEGQRFVFLTIERIRSVPRFHHDFVAVQILCFFQSQAFPA